MPKSTLSAHTLRFFHRKMAKSTLSAHTLRFFHRKMPKSTLSAHTLRLFHRKMVEVILPAYTLRKNGEKGVMVHFFEKKCLRGSRDQHFLVRLTVWIFLICITPSTHTRHTQQFNMTTRNITCPKGTGSCLFCCTHTNCSKCFTLQSVCSSPHVISRIISAHEPL